MKFLTLVLMSLMFVSCASHDRTPSSMDNQDVSRGINTDFYGPR